MKSQFLKSIMFFPLCFPSLVFGSTPLAPDQAFEPKFFIDKNKFALSFNIKPDYYLYSDKLSISPSYPLRLSNISYDHKPELKSVNGLGSFNVYKGTLLISGKFTGTGTLTLSYQGCAVFGLCYPPQKIIFEVTK